VKRPRIQGATEIGREVEVDSRVELEADCQIEREMEALDADRRAEAIESRLEREVAGLRQLIGRL
jgi:hypothetical protein